MGLIDNFFFRYQNLIIWLTITKNIFQKKKQDMIEKRKTKNEKEDWLSEARFFKKTLTVYLTRLE